MADPIYSDKFLDLHTNLFLHEASNGVRENL